MLHGMKETCTEVPSSCRGHELPPVLAFRTTYKVPVTVQEDVEDTKIWSDYITVFLYWNAGWKKGTMPFHERMPFNFHDFLWIFQNLESISMTFPGKENGIPWLFQVFHDWIHPVGSASKQKKSILISTILILIIPKYVPAKPMYWYLNPFKILNEILLIKFHFE